MDRDDVLDEAVAEAVYAIDGIEDAAVFVPRFLADLRANGFVLVRAALLRQTRLFVLATDRKSETGLAENLARIDAALKGSE
jgi:hypothetical protein